MFFLLIREESNEEYETMVRDFRLKIPSDLKDEPEKYRLDLQQASGDYIICKACNNIFPKTHPVYARFHICPDCAVEITDEG